MLRSLAIATLILTAAALAWADDSNAFQWQGEMAAGQTLTIRGVSGDVTADLAPGSEAQVTAVKSGTNYDPSQVQVQVVPYNGGVAICAIYPSSRAGQTNTCDPADLQSKWYVTTDVEVVFTVRLPAGVALDVNTLNGDIHARGLTADVLAVTVNGSIGVSTSGSVQADTVSGSIVATLTKLSWTGTRSFTTVNGSIDVTIPGSADLVVNAATVLGTISTDFPLLVRVSGFSGATLSGTLGSGGRDLDISTVNGSIHLRRSRSNMVPGVGIEPTLSLRKKGF